MWTLLLKSMLDEIGTEMTMNALRPKFNEIGREFANRFIEEYRIDFENLGSVADGLSSFHSSFLKKGRFKRSSDSFSIVTEECPFSGEPSEVCQLFQYFYDGLLEKMNPDFSMQCSGMMTKGDKTCHWLIRKKGKTDGKDDAVPEDPIKVLKLRYARGEITREEYQRMKEELLE